jgi:hypothetical protein
MCCKFGQPRFGIHIDVSIDVVVRANVDRAVDSEASFECDIDSRCVEWQRAIRIEIPDQRLA